MKNCNLPLSLLDQTKNGFFPLKKKIEKKIPKSKKRSISRTKICFQIFVHLIFNWIYNGRTSFLHLALINMDFMKSKGTGQPPIIG